MTEHDLENRLTSALRATALAAPVPTDLATAARERRRTRARRRVTLISAAGALAAVAVVVITWPGGTHPSSARLASPSASRAWIPDGWRSESVGDVELAVPSTWGYGDLSQYCTFEHPELPVFDRPGGASTDVGCIGPGGYGVQFTEPREVDANSVNDPMPGSDDPVRDFPVGSSVRTKVIGGVMVLVVVKDAALADQIIGTVHKIEAFDANGCAPTAAVPTIGLATTVGATGGTFSVCRYHLPDGRLEQSERLGEADSDALREAIAAAPEGLDPDRSPEQCINTGEEEAVQLSTETGTYAWVHYTDCTGHAIDLGASTRKITPGVMHWALSPGWSGATSIPGVIDDLRGLPAP